MSLDFDRDTTIGLTVIYAVGAVVSLWAAIFSPHIFDWMGVDVSKKIVGRNWPKRFLLFLVSQPITFTACAALLWWYPITLFVPPVHFLCTLFCLIAIDFVREDEMWEKGYQRLF